MLKKFERSFSENTGAWVLFFLLAFSVYSHYQTGHKFSQVCEQVLFLNDGYYDSASNKKFMGTGIDLDSMVIEIQQRGALLKSDTPEGRAFKFWEENKKSVVKKCQNRLSTPSDY